MRRLSTVTQSTVHSELLSSAVSGDETWRRADKLFPKLNLITRKQLFFFVIKNEGKKILLFYFYKKMKVENCFSKHFLIKTLMSQNLKQFSFFCRSKPFNGHSTTSTASRASFIISQLSWLIRKSTWSSICRCVEAELGGKSKWLRNVCTF